MSLTKMNMYKSIGYLLISIFMLSCVTYAWFTITDTNHAHLTTKTSGVEVEYQFYVYKNKYHYGSNHQTLIDNTCVIGSIEDLCYQEIKNPIYPELIEGSVAPGERFSFAIAIQSLGSMQGYVELKLGNLESIGYDRLENKIQTAFGYEVTKISYIYDDIETEDLKEDFNYQSYRLFDIDDVKSYHLIQDVPLVHENQFQGTLVVYFDLYYDPTVFGIDENDMPYTNSHIFMQQSLHVHDVYMHVSTQRQGS